MGATLASQLRTLQEAVHVQGYTTGTQSAAVVAIVGGYATGKHASEAAAAVAAKVSPDIDCGTTAAQAYKGNAVTLNPEP